MKLSHTGIALYSICLLAACAGGPMSSGKPFDQSGLPAAVQVPAGNKVALELVGTGDVYYVCNPVGEATGKYAWVFVRPEAKLLDRSGKQVGRYFGPPATWDYWAGSRVTGAQVATAPSGDANLPLQLVKADAATGSAGTFTGTTYIQRVNIQGGAMPTTVCDWINMRQSVAVKYQADYIFYKPM